MSLRPLIRQLCVATAALMAAVSEGQTAYAESTGHGLVGLTLGMTRPAVMENGYALIYRTPGPEGQDLYQIQGAIEGADVHAIFEGDDERLVALEIVQQAPGIEPRIELNSAGAPQALQLGTTMLRDIETHYGRAGSFYRCAPEDFRAALYTVDAAYAEEGGTAVYFYSMEISAHLIKSGRISRSDFLEQQAALVRLIIATPELLARNWCHLVVDRSFRRPLSSSHEQYILSADLHARAQTPINRRVWISQRGPWTLEDEFALIGSYDGRYPWMKLDFIRCLP